MAFSKAFGMDMESWGNRYNPHFNRLLRLRFIKAFEEINIPKIGINSEYAIYPASYYKTVESIGVSKVIDFCFIGGVNANRLQKRSREWVFPFVDKYFGEKSYLNFTDENDKYISKGSFDKTNKVKGFIPRKAKDTNTAVKIDRQYFKTLKQSQFCLCPAGDAPWSMRFYEALMCKSIPIVHYKWESWKTEKESKLDYKYYLASDPEFMYREDWAQHNYDIFLEYHTINKKNILKYLPSAVNKCLNLNCNYMKHPNVLNNGGLYCCVSCKNSKDSKDELKHGNACGKTVWEQTPISTTTTTLMPVT